MIKKIKKRYIILVIILLVVLGLIVFAKKNNNNYTEYYVKKTTVSDTLLLAGTIDATKRVDLGFASSGRVKNVNYNVGDYVKEGQIIAEIEQNRLTADLSQAQANYSLTRVDTSSDIISAQTSLETLTQEQNTIVSGLYTQYLSGDLQAYDLDENPTNKIAPTISGSYLGEVEGEYIIEMYKSSAPSGYSFKLSGLESGTYTAEEFQAGKLGELGLYIQIDPDTSYSNTEWIVPVPNTRSTTYTTRKNAYQSAVATRERLINDAKNNVDRITGTDNQTLVTRDEARQAQARAQVNAVAAQLGDGKIRAPFDGIIAKNELIQGEIVSAFTPQIVMFKDETKELNLKTPEIYINKIQVGDTVSITLDAYEDIIFDGEVSFIDFIDTEVDGIPVYETEITISGDDPRIRVGMNAKAEIISEERNDVLAIPVHYITNESDSSSVLIKTSDTPYKFEKRKVTIGLQGNEGLVEIVDGLTTGDIVVLENN